MDTLRRTAEILTQVLEWFVTLCFFVILLLTIILVVLRYGFNATIVGGNELVEYLFIYTTAFGAAAALARREHIKITWFVDKLHPGLRRGIDVAAYLLIALINAVMILYSIPWIRTVGGFESPVLRLHNGLIQAAVPIGSGLVILFCVAFVVRIIAGESVNRSQEGAAK